MNNSKPHEAVEGLLPPKLDSIPLELKELPRWLAWKLVKRDGKLIKLPIAPLTGRAASSTDSATWASFDDSVGRYQRDKLAGVGFVLGDGFAGIDLDDCRDTSTGELSPLAEYVIGKVDSYAEVSPSGTGVKLIVRGAMPRANVDHHVGFESYSQGRYFTLTGHRLSDAPQTVNERQGQLDSLVAELFPKSSSPKKQPGSALSDREVALSALNVLSAERAEHYSEWLAVGMALHAADPSLLSDWDAWSRSSAKYRDGDCSAKWSSFNGRGLGLGSLIHWARLDSPGWQPPIASTTSTSKDEPEQSTFKLELMPLRKLLVDYPRLRPPIIHGLLRRGETMNLIGSPKVGKSWLSVDLAMAIASGETWLGQFRTERGDVLLLDNELHPETIAFRLPKIAEARRIALEDIADRIVVEPLRGRLRDLLAMQSALMALPVGRFSVIVADAFYRFLPADTDENDNGTMAQLYNVIDHVAGHLGCSFVLIHHATKGSQAGKSVTDIGAGAGAQSRAADCHCVLRPHEESNAVVLDAAVRSWAPIEPVGLRWEWPVFNSDPSLDPSRIKPERLKRSDAPKPPKSLDPMAFVDAYVTSEPRGRDGILTKAIRDGVPDRTAQRLLKAAEADSLVYRWKMEPHGSAAFATQPQPEDKKPGADWSDIRSKPHPPE